MDEIAGYIAPSGILPSEKLLDLFKFVSLHDQREKEAAGERLGFNARPRTGAVINWKASTIMAKPCSERKIAQAMLKIIGLKPSSGNGGPPPGGAATANNDGKFKMTLLYRGSRDGFTALAFHTRCDQKGATLTSMCCSQPHMQPLAGVPHGLIIY